MDETETLRAALAGRYDIERQIGHGGMATVYLARDVRHDRHVAVKVLRPELAAVIGAQRFLSEIKIVAGLQHPHILPLHDSGEANGTVYYVMPYVEGETLRDRLTHEKQLPVDEAVRIASEVASALDYAHRHHVVHRDIKPENILLHDGQALVADFGIALAVSRSDGGSRMTETGMSLGTPHYMAPEQAMGEREITPKADVYALGCVLYEMLSGDPPFTGSTAQAIVARALTESPRALTIQRHTIPRHIEAAVLTALEKLPADRFATAGEFAAALVNPSYGQGTSVDATSREAPRRALARSPLVIALASLALVTSGALAWVLLRPAAPRPVTRVGLAFAAEHAPLADRPFALTRDGAKLAYVGPGDRSTSQLWLKERDRLDPVALAGTTGVLSFSFSPDGQWLAIITTKNQLRKLPLSGGASVALADSVHPERGVAWMDDGSIVYVAYSGRALMRVPFDGKPETLYAVNMGTYWPVALPGSRGVLFGRCAATSCEMSVYDIGARTARSLLAGVAGYRYVPTGHIVYVSVDGGLLALPFSLRTFTVTGAPVPIQDGISAGFVASFDVASDGTLVTQSGPSGGLRASYAMVWVDRDGRESPAADTGWAVNLSEYGSPPDVGWALSPDGRRLAIGAHSGAGDDIWIKQLPNGPLSRLSFDSAAELRPRWTRDGNSVLFSSVRTGLRQLYRRNADATGSDTLVFSDPRGIFESVLSGDGKTLVLRTGGITGGGGRDISIARLGVDTAPRPLISTPFDEEAIALSPDGKWIAYESDETGRTEVFIRPFPNTDAGKQQVSTNGGGSPLWSRNGRELFYVNGARSMVAVAVGAGDKLQIGEGKTLFHLRDDYYLHKSEYYTPFDISPDGRRFIMARQRVSTGAGVQAQPLVMVTNWFEELKAKTRK